MAGWTAGERIRWITGAPFWHSSASSGTLQTSTTGASCTGVSDSLDVLALRRLQRATVRLLSRYLLPRDGVSRGCVPGAIGSHMHRLQNRCVFACHVCTVLMTEHVSGPCTGCARHACYLYSLASAHTIDCGLQGWNSCRKKAPRTIKTSTVCCTFDKQDQLNYEVF